MLLHHLSREGDRRAKLVEAFRENPRRFFGTTLIGTNICIITLSAVGAHAMFHSAWGVNLAVATILVDIIVLVTAEITPKTLSLSNPTRNSLRAAGLLEISARILAPAIWLLTFLPSKILNIDHIFHSGKGDVITESQLIHMIDLSARQGGIRTSEGERAVKVFKFADMTVGDVMTPRADIATLISGDTLRKALSVANATGYSRVPVVSRAGDDSPGFLAVKDILRLQQEGRLDEPVDAHLRPIVFVPETKRILDLLSEFRSTGDQIALAVNEFGTITGLVTLEDLLEEILGEIYDEYDRDTPDAEWVKGSLVLFGIYPAAKLADRLKVKLPEGEYDTAAGLLLHLLGHVPQPGESVALDGWTLTATHVLRHRITRIVARQTDQPESRS